MAAPPSPVVASWELALRLKRRREQLGVEVRTITEALGFTRNYWSAVENERKILSRESLTRILELFEFDAEEKEELLALRAAAKERGWWTRYPALFDNEIQRLFGLEQGARSIRDYENLLIPGLLQTADYTRGIMMPDVTMRPVEVDQRIEARLRRQERLIDSNDPFKFTAVISEASLRQQIGGPRVLRPTGAPRHLDRATSGHARYPGDSLHCDRMRTFRRSHGGSYRFRQPATADAGLAGDRHHLGDNRRPHRGQEPHHDVSGCLPAGPEQRGNTRNGKPPCRGDRMDLKKKISHYRPHRTGWFKSSYSNAGGSCVEAQFTARRPSARQ